MFLDFFKQIENFFMKLFEKFEFSSLITLLMGIVIGFLIFSAIYIVLVFTNFKKDEKKAVNSVPNVNDEDIVKIIKSAKNQYIEACYSITTAKKFEEVKVISLQLLEEIAQIYYPDSKYPIYELSIDELVTLSHYITDRIDSIFKGKILVAAKQIKISQIMKFLDLKKKVDENKAIKTANKLNVSSKVTAVLSVLNVFNPVYWVKKLMINTTISAASNKIALTIIEVVGEETNKVYSKSVFNVEKNIKTDVEKAIYELETMMDSEE